MALTRNEQMKVVVNHEEQYAIWPADRAAPSGWRDAGKTGSKDECIAHIGKVWTFKVPDDLRSAAEELMRSKGLL